ncbi:MAG: rod shape-determining protein MreC [Vulcanimicrobiaceae bacterium]
MIGIIIVAAALASMQIVAQRNGTQSPTSVAGTTVAAVGENAVTSVAVGVRSAVSGVAALPGLSSENAGLRRRNAALLRENANLHALADEYAAQLSVQPIVNLYAGAIEARVIGFPPENESRTVTLDRGSQSGVRKDDAVLADGGAVGRIESVGPFSSTVVLVNDYTSQIPAVAREGRWWGIARGNLSSVRFDYVSQDARLRVGDVVVTGEGRSFHAGVPIGTIVRVDRGDSALYQSADLKPAVDLGALDRVVIVPK